MGIARATAIGLLCISVSPAHAAETLLIPCPLTEQLENGLQNDQYNEHQIGEGTTDHTGIGQLWLSQHGGWSFTMKLLDGRTCLLAFGDRWRWTADKLIIPEDPT